MTSYHLTIITTNGQVFDGPVESLVATGKSGSFGILGQHAPMVIALRHGPLIIKHGGMETYYAISSGVLEVNDQSDCLLLADFANKAKSLENAKHLATDTSVIE